MKNRSLSPHLTIYKTQLTSLVSIFHRITGTVLTITLISFALLFHISHCFIEYYSIYVVFSYFEFYISWFINLVFIFLIGFVYFHFANGIRHLSCDLGYGLDIKYLNATGLFVLTIASLVLVIVLV